ncbi:hypothetical protein [Gracilibacillus oryzae]|nr:hypothetical protein [Gracilibacillus oryzae]
MDKEFHPKESGKLMKEQFGTKKDKNSEEAVPPNVRQPIVNLKK